MKRLLQLGIVQFMLGISMSFTCSLLHADEGMWLFNNPPKKLLKEKYNFEPSDEWLKNVQQSAVRFNSGGSGAFISPEGLGYDQSSRGRRCLAEAQHAGS